MVDMQCAAAEIGEEKQIEEEDKNHSMKI